MGAEPQMPPPFGGFSNYRNGKLLEKAPDCWEGPNETG